MDAKAFLKELIDIPGVSGYEDEISRVIMDAFKPYCHEVRRDAFFNVYGKNRQCRTEGTQDNAGCSPG